MKAATELLDKAKESLGLCMCADDMINKTYYMAQFHAYRQSLLTLALSNIDLSFLNAYDELGQYEESLTDLPLSITQSIAA